MSRLPRLGPRGEGWVAIQFALLCAIAASAFLGPAWGGNARIISTLSGVVLLVAGGVLAIRGMSDLRGALTPLPYPKPHSQLVETGVYRLVRHPIYGGLILAALGWGLLWASPVTVALALVLLGFFELKSRVEENWLVERFADYPAYRARTRRLIPWIG